VGRTEEVFDSQCGQEIVVFYKGENRRDCFSEVSGLDMKLAAHLRLVRRLRNSGAYLHFYTCLYGVPRDHLIS
jgi:hypothetical protein